MPYWKITAESPDMGQMIVEAPDQDAAWFAARNADGSAWGWDSEHGYGGAMDMIDQELLTDEELKAMIGSETPIYSTTLPPGEDKRTGWVLMDLTREPSHGKSRTGSAARTAAIQRAAIKDARKTRKGKRPAMTALLAMPRTARARKTKAAQRAARNGRGPGPTRRFNGRTYFNMNLNDPWGRPFQMSKGEALSQARIIRTRGVYARVVPTSGGYSVYATQGFPRRRG